MSTSRAPRTPRTTRVWRIVKAEWAESAFDGEGARRFGGRWNAPGTPAVYAASQASLAVLELLAHAHLDELPPSFRLIPAEVPTARIREVNVAELPAGWDARMNPESARAAAQSFFAGDELALRVPSVVLPIETNVVLNPRSRHFGSVRIGAPVVWQVDARFVPSAVRKH